MVLSDAKALLENSRERRFVDAAAAQNAGGGSVVPWGTQYQYQTEAAATRAECVLLTTRCRSRRTSCQTVRVPSRSCYLQVLLLLLNYRQSRCFLLLERVVAASWVADEASADEGADEVLRGVVNWLLFS